MFPEPPPDLDLRDMGVGIGLGLWPSIIAFLLTLLLFGCSASSLAELTGGACMSTATEWQCDPGQQTLGDIVAERFPNPSP